MRPRQVIQLHQLAQQGTRTSEIANILGVHRNTVLDHLSFRVAYPPELLKKIARFPHDFQLPAGDPIKLYEAAVYLPGWPCRDKTYALYQRGVIRAKIARDGSWRGLVVSRAAIRRAAEKMMPEGIWIRADRVAIFAGQEVANECLPQRIACKHWPENHSSYVDAAIVSDACRRLDQRLLIPAKIIHRAIRTLDVAGVATI